MRIEKRRNRYFLIHILPSDVRPLLGKTRLTAALKTDNREIAELRAAVLRPKWRALVDDARGRIGSGAMGDAADFWRAELATASDGERQIIAAFIAGEALRASPAFWRAELAKAEPSERPGILAGIADEANARAQAETISRALPKGQVPAEHDEAAAAAAQRWFDQATGRVVPLREHLDLYITSLSVEPKTAAMRRKTISGFIARHPLTSDVTRKKLQAWADALAGEGYAPATVKRALSEIRGFWRFLVDADQVPVGDDPFARVKIKELKGQARAAARDAWLPEEIAALHRAALAKDDRPLADMIAIAAFTGMRLEEVGNLTAADVSETRIVIRAAKSDAGVRQVPVHPKLVPLLARLKAAAGPDGFLLPGTANKYGDRSGAIGKRFGRLKTELNYPASLVFHSIRKTVASIFHDAGVPEQHAAPILGHKLSTMSYGTYSTGPRLQTLAEVIKVLDYPGLEP